MDNRGGISPAVQVHSMADVQTEKIGPGTRIWQFCVVYEGAIIGDNCNICAHVLIESDVILGNNVTVKSGVQLWDGLRVEDDVFIGPNVTFTNDPYPRSKVRSEPFLPTKVGKGASIGGGAVILPGVVIGAGAMVGAGAVVSKSVSPHTIVVGNPARVVGNTRERA